MKRITFFCILIIQAILLVGCRTVERNIVEEAELDEGKTNEIAQNIVFICNRQQYNENYYNLGYFIDNLGNKSYFDLSDKSIDYAEDISVLYEYLNENIEKYEKIPFLEKEQLYECYEYLNLVDENAEIEEECVMADYGAYFLYGVRLSESGNVELILLEEYGDWNRINLDDNVDNIIEIIGKDTWRDNF